MLKPKGVTLSQVVAIAPDGEAGNPHCERPAHHGGYLMSENLNTRDTKEVLEDHLRSRIEGRLEQDLRRNYSEDVILLTANSNLTGHDAIRVSASRLNEQLPNAEFEFLAKQVSGPFALLIWRGNSKRLRVRCGADTFVITIRMQSIHYVLEE